MYLTKEQFKKLKSHLSTFFLTGTTLFFGKGNDIDYVVDVDKFETLLNEEIILDNNEKDGYDGSFTMRRYKTNGKTYDFIIVEPELLPLWKLATRTAMVLLQTKFGFREWFKKKENRKAYFRAFLYS